MATILDGRLVSAATRERIREKTAEFIEKTGHTPGLSVILVGSDPASCVYVRNKRRACGDVGFRSEIYELPEETTEEELLSLIEKLNRDEGTDGILVQLPLPKQISEEAIIKAIDPKKDVDAFHPENVGGICTGNYTFLPCTPAGVMVLLEYYGIDPKGKHCVVVGRSNIVGKPQALLMLEKNATVTICHSKTENLAEEVKRADIVVAAVGRPNFITGDMIKEGAVVVDVGINRLPDGTLCGDVDFAAAEKKASYITPVPGGVGPMTITMLMENTLRAAASFAEKKK